MLPTLKVKIHHAPRSRPNTKHPTGAVKVAGGQLVPASIRELRAHFSLVFNSPPNLSSPISNPKAGGRTQPTLSTVVYISISCERTIGYLTYPSSLAKHRERGQETATPVVLYVDEAGVLVETSPSLFETQQANSNAKKWRGSFKAVGE